MVLYTGTVLLPLSSVYMLWYFLFFLVFLFFLSFFLLNKFLYLYILHGALHGSSDLGVFLELTLHLQY